MEEKSEKVEEVLAENEGKKRKIWYILLLLPLISLFMYLLDKIKGQKSFIKGIYIMVGGFLAFFLQLLYISFIISIISAFYLLNIKIIEEKEYMLE